MATGYEPNVEGALVVLVDIMNANAFTMTRQPYEPNYRGLVDALIDLKEGFPVFSPERVGFDVTTFEAVGDGDALYLRASDGKAGKARANGGSDEARVIGFADTAASSGATVKCLVAGVLDYPSTINPGDVYFLSATPGAISTTPPSTTGHYIVRVGEGATATELSIQINAPIQLGNVPAFLYYTTASVSSFRIKAVGSPNYDVDWGDGSTETGITMPQKDHTYSSAGVYTIKITPAVGSTFQPEQYGVPDYDTNLTSVSGTGGSQLGTDITKWLRETTSLTSFDAIDTSSVTNFQAAWRECTGLTSFPLIDTSSATNFQSAWHECTGLTSFPLLNTSNVTNMNSAWVNCSALTQFPSIDTSSVTNFTDAWNGCTGLTSFPSIDTSSGTSLQGAWLNCSGLSSFPALNTSNVTVFRSAWQNCSGITTFPSINTSSATDFRNSWQDCSSLTTYPANQFNSTGTLRSDAFNLAWVNCALTAQSIENILTSLDTNGAQNITLGIHGGSNASKTTWSTAANTAYTNLINKGWTITFNS